MPGELSKYSIWVLVPSLETDDSNLDYYYDFSQSYEEYKRVFNALGIQWHWQPVTMDDYRQVIDKIAALNGAGDQIVFNLCDGDEINQVPGISVIHYLDQQSLLYTGADADFYRITTSKIPMKRAFDQHAVPTPAWEMIPHPEQDLHAVFEQLGTPIILKPAVSGGSMGIGIRNVVDDIAQCKTQVEQMFEGYRGWQLTGDGLIAESFVDGPEFTVFVLGSYHLPDQAKIFMPVERVFHASLPAREKFLSFDRLWEIYEEETAMPNDEFFYQYQLPDEAVVTEIQQLAWDAFVACKGIGYTRVDIRMDSATKKMFVLEVNAQCGISEDEDFTSIGAILRVSNTSFTALVASILNETIQRGQSFSRNQ